MAAKLTKVEAINELTTQATRTKQPTVTQWRRILRALDSLDLSPGEARDVCRGLDIVDEKGKPFYVTGVIVPWGFQ